MRVGGVVAFHDARDGIPGGTGRLGPTEVVNELRGELPPGWGLVAEVDSLVVAQRSR